MAGMQVAGVDVDELLDVVGVVAVDLVQLAHQLPLNLQEKDQALERVTELARRSGPVEKLALISPKPGPISWHSPPAFWQP